MNKATRPEQADYQSHDINTAALAAVAERLPKLVQLNQLLEQADGVKGDAGAIRLLLNFHHVQDQAGELLLKVLYTPNAKTIGVLISLMSSLTEQGQVVLELLQCERLVLRYLESGGDA